MLHNNAQKPTLKIAPKSGDSIYALDLAGAAAREAPDDAIAARLGLDYTALRHGEDAWLGAGAPTFTARSGAGQKLQSNRLDFGWSAQWLAGEPAEHRLGYLALMKRIQRIPPYQFEDALRSSIDDLQSRIVAERPLLAVLTKAGARASDSKAWLVQGVVRRYPKLLDGILLATSSSRRRVKEEATWAPYRGKTVDLCLIDDASYSGTQMRGDINVFIRSKLLTYNVTAKNIYVAVAGITRDARESLDTFKFSWRGNQTQPRVTVVGNPVILPKVQELMAFMTAREANAVAQGCWTTDMTISYLWHKVPDAISAILVKELAPLTVPPYKGTERQRAPQIN